MVELTAFLDAAPLSFASRLTAIAFLLIQPWKQFDRGAAVHLITSLYKVLLLIVALFGSFSHVHLVWWAIVGLHFAWLYKAYAVADNHKYLEGYWLLAIAIAESMGGHDGCVCLSRSGLLLIGVTFLVAVVWKLVNPRYRDGSFFLYQLCHDARFTHIASVLGGMTPALRKQHIAGGAMRPAGIGATCDHTVSISPRMHRVARLLTYWTVFVEIAVAAVFLMPFTSLEAYRIAALAMFVITTYSLVPVTEFGSILIVIALPTTHTDEGRIALFVLLVISQFFPLFASALTRLTRRRTPVLRWTEAATPRRLERDGDAVCIVFPTADVVIEIAPEWASDVETLLAFEHTFSVAEARAATNVLSEDIVNFLRALTRVRMLSRGPRYTDPRQFVGIKRA